MPTPLFKHTQPPRRVLVIVTRRIGDVLLATPVVHSIKRAWPGAAIDMLVFEGTEGFVKANPDVNRVITVPPRPRFLEHLRFVLSLARKYELALSLLHSDRATLYAFVSGKRRAGVLSDRWKERWKRGLLNRWVPFDGIETHTVRMYLALLDTVGVAAIPEVVLSYTAEDEQSARALLQPLAGAPFAVLHPYPKFRYKMWTEAGWIETAHWLEKRNLRVVLTGGPDAAEREYVSALAARMPGSINAAGLLTLGGIGYVLSRAAVYVGPDTAITHAAAGLGVPTVALFGPSNPVKWGPWPAGTPFSTNPWQRIGTQAVRNVRLVQGFGACVPCAKNGCDRHLESWSNCLLELPSTRVIAAIAELLG
ncbi:MAG TPA: glycosyltransferase family 9 protein [Burkholderiales bacterium]|nr:glycosyltransferase family 9 protein [Burkholderiales bacterium]